MRVAVVHTTVYRYSEPVQLEPHTFRLRPRDDAAQRLSQHSFSVAPLPAGRSQCLDQDGNVVVEAWFDHPTDSLSIESAFTVDTLRENPFDFLLRRSMATLPARYTEAVRAALVPYLATATDAVSGFAAEVALGCGGETMDFLNALNQRLAGQFRYVERENGPPHEAEVTLKTREGSCRDLSVLFCQAARAMGLAARFVSGYACDANGESKTHLHAWSEVYLEGGGWRGYDPSAGLAVGAGHVALAAAADPRLAAPVTGTFRGRAEAVMEFAIAISALPGR